MPTASSGPTAITVPTGSSAGTATPAFWTASALEVLSALSDAFQREYLSSVEISQGIYYNELEKLCLRHGYTKEDNA